MIKKSNKLFKIVQWYGLKVVRRAMVEHLKMDDMMEATLAEMSQD